MGCGQGVIQAGLEDDRWIGGGTGAQRLAHRRPRSGDEHRRAAGMRASGEAGDRRRGRRVDQGNGRDVDDIGLGPFADLIKGRADRGRRAEEEGARDAVDNDLMIARLRRIVLGDGIAVGPVAWTTSSGWPGCGGCT